MSEFNNVVIAKDFPKKNSQPFYIDLFLIEEKWIIF